MQALIILKNMEHIVNMFIMFKLLTATATATATTTTTTTTTTSSTSSYMSLQLLYRVLAFSTNSD